MTLDTLLNYWHMEQSFYSPVPASRNNPHFYMLEALRLWWDADDANAPYYQYGYSW